MPVEFSNFKFNDHGQPFTVENAFRFYGAWSGLHDFDFDQLVNLASLSPSSSSGWSIELDTTELPVDHTVYYACAPAAAYQGIVVGATDNQNYYLVCTEGAATVKVYKVVAGVSTLKLALNVPGESAVGSYICSFRPFMLGSEDDDLWLAISLWRDHRHILSYTEKLAEPLLGPYYVGVAGYGGNSITYTDIVVPELCMYAEYGTLDPGESAAGGLQRAIEGRYLVYFARFNGTIRAFRPKTQTSQLTVSRRDISFRSRHFDLRDFATHVRMMGAYGWGEAADLDLIAYYGHRFAEVTNPMLMSENDCIEEAQRQLRRIQSEAETCELRSANLPLMEPEDRITVQGEDWLISGYSKEVVPGAIRTSYSLRKYVEGV